MFFFNVFGKGLCLSSCDGQCGEDCGCDESFHCNAMFLVIDRLNEPKLPGAADLRNSAWAEGQKLSAKRAKVSL
jgi:hypothetical protein